MTDINGLVRELGAKGELTRSHSEERNRLSNAISQASRVNPDQAAERQRLADQSGFPPDYVERNTDDVRNQVTLNDIPIDDLLKDAPTTSEFLSNYRNAEQSHDDWANLSSIEMSWRGMGQLATDSGRSFAGGPVRLIGSGLEGLGAGADRFTGRILEGISAILPESADKYIWANDPEAPQFLKDIARFTAPSPMLESTGGALMEQSEAIFPPEERQNVITKVVGATGELAALATMSFINPALANTMMAGSGIQQQAERQEALGVYADSISGDLALIQGGTVELILERTGLDFLLRRMPPNIKNSFLRNFTDIAASAGVEAAQEAGAEVMQNLIEYANYNPDAEIFVGLEEPAVVGGGAGALFRSLLLTLDGKRMRSRAESDAAKIDEVMSRIQESKLKGRNPELIRDYLRELGNATESDTLYVDADGVGQLFQKITDRAVLDSPVFLELADQYQDAYYSGAKVEIPISMLPDLIDQGLARDLQPYMTSDIDGVSPFQAFDADFQAEVAELRNMQFDVISDQTEVYNDVLGQELARGKDRSTAETHATLTQAFYSTQARRDGLGRTAIEIFRERNPRYRNQVDPLTQARARRIEKIDTTLDMIRNGEIPTDGDIFGDSLLKFIRREGGIIDEGGELSGRDLNNLIRNNTGRSLDDIAERAVEEGYMQERDINALLDLIDDEARGNPVYRLGQENAQLQKQAADLRQLSDLLDREGIDLAEMTNEQVREWLDGGTQSTETQLSQDDTQVDGQPADASPTLNQPVRPINEAYTPEEIAFFRSMDLINDNEIGQIDAETGQQTEPGPTGSGRIPADLQRRTVAGGRPDQQWAENTRVKRNGEPAIVYRGENFELTAEDFTDNLGRSTQHPSANLGVWFTTERNDARRYGTPAEYYLDMRNPKVYGRNEDVPEFNSAEDAAALSESLQAEGFDGIMMDYRDVGGPVHFVAFNPDQVIPESEGGQGAELYQRDGGPIVEASNERDLYVAHNISADGIRHVLEIGGLAAPSIAVTRTGNAFDGYGEITLLTDPAFLQSKKVRTFDADVYSPRHPQAENIIENKKAMQFIERMGETYGLRPLSIADIEDGPRQMLHNPSLKYHWLNEQGKAPALPKAKVDPLVKKVAAIDGSRYDLQENQQVIDMATKQAKSEWAQFQEVIAQDSSRDEALYRGKFLDDDGTVSDRYIQTLVRNALEFRETKGIDKYALEKKVQAKLRTKKARSEFEAYVRDTFNSMLRGRQIFQGFTNAGDRRYTRYTLDNVVKEMTKKLQSGENFNYGAGSVRSAYAGEFRSIEQIQAARERIVSPEEMQVVKDEANDRLSDALDALKPFYKFEADGYGYMNDAASAITEGPSGIREAFNVTPEVNAIIKDLTDYLTALPTDYFEAKVQRAAQLDEFNVAVVPRDVDADVVSALKDFGLKVAYYTPGDTDSRRQAVERAASKNNLLFSRDRDGLDDARGSFNWKTNEITFTKKQNFSTFVHESAHLFLQVMMDMAPESASIQADMDILEGWWSENGAKTYVQKQEMFASGFEAYTMEGKAPIKALQPIFNRFRVWMNMVYKAMGKNPFRENDFMGVELSDDVRGVMDRMLATQEQIDAAQADNLVGPFTGEMLGLTPEQADELQQLMNEAEDQSVADLTAQVMSEYKRETKAWWKNARDDMREEVKAEVDAERVYQLRDALTGDRPAEDGSAIKLNRAYVKSEYGRDVARKLGRMLSDNGIHPDTLSLRYNYENGDALMMDLINSMNKSERTQRINAEADARMKSRYGDMLNDGSMTEAAQRVVHNDKQSELMLKELSLLDAKTGKKPTPRQVFKAAAEQNINEMRVIDIKPNKYLRAEQQAKTKAVKLATKGDFKAAAFEMRKAVYQHYLYKEATQAIDKSDKFKNYGRSLMKGKRLDNLRKAGDSYLDQVNSILGWVELKAVNQKTLAKRKSLAEFINQQMQQAGAGDPTQLADNLTESERATREAEDAQDAQSGTPSPMITESMMVQAETTNYRELTPTEQAEIMSMLQSVYHLAKLKSELLTSQDKRSLEERIDELTQVLDKNANNVRARKIGSVKDKSEVWSERIAEAWDSSRTPTSLIRMFDGFEDGGVAWDLLGQPLQDAAVQESLQIDSANRELEAIFNTAYTSTELKNMNRLIPGERVSKHDVISMLLNWGSVEGRQRVLDGFGISTTQVNGYFRSYIDGRDMEFVRQIWSYLETYKQASFDLHRDMFGYSPTEVKAAPFDLNGETMPGGYYPIKYDPSKSAAAEQNALRSQVDPVAQSLASKGKLGSNIARVQKMKRPLNTDMTQVIFGHIAETIHATTHHRALYDVGRILADDRVKNSINDNYGEHVYKALNNLVREIKLGADKANTTFERVIRWARNNATFAMLGFSLRTVVLQPFGMTNSFVRLRLSGVSGTRLVSSYGQFMSDPAGWTKTIKEKSDYMITREQVMSAAISRITQRIKRTGKLGKMQELAMVPMQKAQFYSVDAPLWLASYQYSIDTGLSETQAVKRADQHVRDAQGGGNQIDIAESMRGGPAQKLFTNFLSYMITTFTLADQNFKAMKRGDINALDFAINSIVLIAMPAMLTALLNDFIAGEEDDEPLYEKYLREQIAFVMSMNPILAQFSGAVSGFDYSGPQGTAIISKTIQLAQQLEQGDLDEGLAKSAIWVFGLSTGAPAAQINRTMGGIKQAIEDGDSPFELAKKAGFGPER